MREMKDSGIKWVGVIPEVWSTKPVKQLFKIGRGRVIAQTELVDDGEYPVFSSQTQNNGCLGYINTYDFDTQQLTWTTDGANAGTVFLREGKHNCTNVCGTLEPKNEKLNLRYALYSLAFIAEYHKRYDTNGFKIMNNEMAEIKITFPPLPEQQSIADYLDRKCALIDSTIEKQKAVIEKLKLYKQSVITEAVTKGLDKNAKMKPSGIEWIGDISQKWEIRKLKSITVLISKGTTPSTIGEETLSEGRIHFIKAENIRNNMISLTPEFFINDKTNNFLSRSQLKENDILFVIAGATIGKTAILDYDSLPANTNQAVSFIRLQRNQNVRFVWYYLQAQYVISTLKLLSVQSAQPNISMGDLGNFYISYPDKNQQTLITNYLDEKCSGIDNAIKNKQKVIEKLTEYKKSLIYECVTGKKEV